jgi:hypothetical protein
MRPEGVTTLRFAEIRSDPIAQCSWRGFWRDVEASASLSDRAHASQHTSTVFPPTLTVIGLASSSQSQAAQVFAVMIPSPLRPDVRAEIEEAFRGCSRCQNL